MAAVANNSHPQLTLFFLCYGGSCFAAVPIPVVFLSVVGNSQHWLGLRQDQSTGDAAGDA